MYLVEGGHPNEMLDIPPEFTNWKNYQASTGNCGVGLSWTKKDSFGFPMRLQKIFSQGHLINHNILLKDI